MIYPEVMKHCIDCGAMDVWDAAYPGVHEDEVHLHEGEDELSDRVDSPEDHVTWRVRVDLQEHSELQSVVDHRAQAESCNNLSSEHLQLNW